MQTLFFSKGEYYKIIWRYMQLITACYLPKINYAHLGLPVLYS